MHYHYGSSIATQVVSGKNTISNVIEDVIGISGTPIKNLDGEFKEMIMVKTGHSTAFIASVTAALTSPNCLSTL